MGKTIIYLIIVVLSITFISGCIGENAQERISMRPQDTGTVDATVLSLVNYDSCPVATEGICPVDTNPVDYVTIRVDSIIEYKRSDDATFPLLAKGSEFEQIMLSFSSRPAIVRHVPMTSLIPPNDGGESEPSSNQTIAESSAIIELSDGESIPREGGYYIYTIYSGGYDLQFDTQLSGFSEGDKIRFKFIYSDLGISIGEYEVIS